MRITQGFSRSINYLPRKSLTTKEKKNKKKRFAHGTKSAFTTSSTFFATEILKAQGVTKKKVVQKTETLHNFLLLKALWAKRQARPRRKALNLRELATICFVCRNENANDKRTEQNYK
jgi:hypothetical protein